MKHDVNVWMKVREDQHCTLDVCIIMPMDSTSIAVVEGCYGRLNEDVLSFREKGQVVLLGDFNACVGRSVEVDDVIGMCESMQY